jgi:hypothetical protein
MCTQCMFVFSQSVKIRDIILVSCGIVYSRVNAGRAQHVVDRATTYEEILCTFTVYRLARTTEASYRGWCFVQYRTVLFSLNEHILFYLQAFALPRDHGRRIQSDPVVDSTTRNCPFDWGPRTTIDGTHWTQHYTSRIAVASYTNDPTFLATLLRYNAPFLTLSFLF